MTDKATLTPKQIRAIEALTTAATAGDISKAADLVGINRATIYKWMRTAPFQAALKTAEGAALESLSRALVAMGEKSTGVLSTVLDDPTAKNPDRLRAVSIVLDSLLKLRELVDLEERVRKLEDIGHATQKD
jgi:transposase-like protein